MTKKTFKKTMAKIMVFAMLFTTAIGFVPAKDSTAATLSKYLNMEFGIKYSGETKATANKEGTAWSIEYFNVADSAFQEGDIFFVSCKFSGATNFKQIGMQSSVNNWDWNSAPKAWSKNGIADGTTVCGRIVASKSDNNVSFKIQFDNVVNAEASTTEQNITLTDLYIMKLGNTEDEVSALPEDKKLELGAKYSGTVTAVKNEDVYEAQYFNVNNSSYSEDDIFIISYSIGNADSFKQVAIQSNLNSWSWAEAKKVWSDDGISDGQNVDGSFTASSAGNGISFKIRVDSQKDSEEDLGDSIELAINNLTVIKVGSDDSIALPDTMELNKDRKYSGAVTAEKDGGSWNVQYFNVITDIKEGEQFRIDLNVSNAQNFKQLAVQSNVNGWDWTDAPKIWKSEGLDEATLSAIITATGNYDKITFKLWFDNPVNKDFDEASVPVTLTNLQIKDIAKVGNLGTAYASYFDVGAAVSADMVGDIEYQNRIKGCFKTITAENEMKPDALLNQKASEEAAEEDPNAEPVLYLEYSGMTKILDFAKENNLKVRGHALIYAQQTPDWFFHEGYTTDGKNVTSSVMDKRMESYIRQVITFVETNYKDVVTSWDVVNEALNDDGLIISNMWRKTIGVSYIQKAFQYATEYAPNTTKLYYNDYNMENSDKINGFNTKIRNGLPAGARIDGIGMQEHCTTVYPNVADISKAIDTYSAAGLDVQITELDVQIEADETLEAQAERYAELFTLFKDKSDKISNVTVWGINDSSSWKSAKRPLLFYDDLTAKPALDSVLALVTPQS